MFQFTLKIAVILEKNSLIQALIDASLFAAAASLNKTSNKLLAFLIL